MSYRNPFLSKDARAVIAAYPSIPNERKRLIADFITAMKDVGFWQKLDLLYVLAAPSESAALVNWKSPGTLNLTKSGTVTHRPDLSMKGDGSSGTLEAVGYAPSLLTLNDAMIGCYTRTASTYGGGTSRIDLYTGTGRLQRRSDVANFYTARINDTTSLQPDISGAQTGHFMVQRTGATARALYKNGVSVASDSAASTGVASQFKMLSIGTGNWSDAGLSLAYAGASIPAADVEHVNAIITEYLRAIGAVI